VVDVDSVVEWTVLRRIESLWGANPFGQGIGRVQFAEYLADTQVSELEVNCPRILGTHFVSRKRREDVVEVNVLMGIMVHMEILDCLQETTGDWHDPELLNLSRVKSRVSGQ